MGLQIVINGQQRVFDGLAVGASILDLIGALELKSDRIALEHNGEIAPRTAWGEMPVGDGDKVEIVHFVGGGRGEKADPPSHPATMML